MFSPEPVTAQTCGSAPAETGWTRAPGGAPVGQDCPPSLQLGPRSPSQRPGLCSGTQLRPKGRPSRQQLSFPEARGPFQSLNLRFRLANLWGGGREQQ